MVAPNEPHWWPQHDPEPDERVLAVALYGQTPGFLRLVRGRGGWHRRGWGAHPPGVTPPVPWVDVGRCWAGVHHAVIDATDLVASAEQRPRLLLGDPATRSPELPARSPLPGAPPSPDGAAAARRGSGR